MFLTTFFGIIILIQHVYVIQVKVEQGWLRGERLIASLNQKPYFSFKGVPYAEPPIGKLRFMAPRPPLPWKGVKNATKHGPKCIQISYLTNVFVPGSENCLFINIYSPDINPKTPLPVIFLIHGGHLQSGSGDVDDWGPDFLVNYGVVVVTINYRLEVLGFLNLETPEVPGNAGLKDQVIAMKWVQENIHNFGGDPKKVTIVGPSAGGICVTLHLFSPISKGLFTRAIAMSGVFLVDWSIPVKPKERAFTLGRQLGIKTQNVTKLFEFLQGVPAHMLVGTKPSIYISENVVRDLTITTDFTPVIEKDFGMDHFLTEDPQKLLREGVVTNDADIMIGHVNKEGLYYAAVLEKYILEYYPMYKELFVPRKIINKSIPNKTYQLAECIINYYYGNKFVSLDNMDIFINFFSYYYNVYDIHRFLNMIPKTGNFTRYFYQFSGISERNVFAERGLKYGVIGASHSDDRMYIFDAKKYNLTIDKGSISYELIQRMCTFFTNFAKYGNPTPDNSFGTIWPKYNDDTRIYLDIAEYLTQGKVFFNGSLGFWKRILNSAGIDFE